ncbi:1-deoxy-D-xylulose-5-phosphate synthase [Oleidesulfovibrio sp.]|uniref:1-deoxy-D-xylulose-5-phosphate synthase n=1 Tax=Oleidesulfovibrio sp. TaxID=2909707 RepID=UPI003A8B9D80
MSQSGDMIENVLDSIKHPTDVAKLDADQMKQLAAELRERIISTVSQNGGHLAPSLGVVELTLAMLSVFDPEKDKFIWDVGHQAYAWKLLTGRRDEFSTLRQFNGVSGFPKMSESPYDHFGVGHSSTSISAAAGMAMARDLSGDDHDVIAVIGDGSMTAGLAFEGLNQAGHQGRRLLVILNDNEMSISKNVGALSLFLSRNLSSRWVRRMKRDVETWLKSVPGIGEEMLNYAKRSEHSLKSFFTPGMLFEAFRFNYVGPVDGHDVRNLAKVMEMARKLDEPVLLHVLTKKGKGYEPAEHNPTYFHGVGKFELETGEACKFVDSDSLPSYTEVFGNTLCTLAEKDERIIAITAAMPEGTGVGTFSRRFPDRFVDVGICEQHAVTFAAGLAAQGYRPVVAIYSTFLQRSYDQIVHDVCLQNLPVTFCLDRGGLVGEDGPTHHGSFDLSYLRHIPNLTIIAPKDEAELQDAMKTAINSNGPVAIRYPRGIGSGACLKSEPDSLEIGVGEVLKQGSSVAVVAVGSRVHPALAVANEIENETGKAVTVFNARFVKPLDVDKLVELASTHEKLLLLEENTIAGGFSSAVLEALADRTCLGGVTVKRLGLPDSFVPHGTQKQLRKLVGIDKQSIRNALLELLA